MPPSDTPETDAMNFRHPEMADDVLYKMRRLPQALVKELPANILPLSDELSKYLD